MVLSHEDLQAIARSLGAEQAAPIIRALEKMDQEHKVEVKRDLLLELATKADIANLRTEVTEVRGEVKRLETLIKILIGLVMIAISFFSPVGAEIIKLLK